MPMHPSNAYTIHAPLEKAADNLYLIQEQIAKEKNHGLHHIP